MQIEGSHSNLYSVTNDVDPGQLQSSETYKEEIKLLKIEIETLKEKNMNALKPVEPTVTKEVPENVEDVVVEIHEDKNMLAHMSDEGNMVVDNGDIRSLATQTPGNNMSKSDEVLHELTVVSSNNDNCMENKESISEQNGQQLTEDNVLPVKENNPCDEAVFEKVISQFLIQFTFEQTCFFYWGLAAILMPAQQSFMFIYSISSCLSFKLRYMNYDQQGLGTIQILADALPKIVPYVLINHREVLFSLSVTD